MYADFDACLPSVPLFVGLLPVQPVVTDISVVFGEDIGRQQRIDGKEFVGFGRDEIFFIGCFLFIFIFEFITTKDTKEARSSQRRNNFSCPLCKSLCPLWLKIIVSLHHKLNIRHAIVARSQSSEIDAPDSETFDICLRAEAGYLSLQPACYVVYIKRTSADCACVLFACMAKMIPMQQQIISDKIFLFFIFSLRFLKIVQDICCKNIVIFSE